MDESNGVHLLNRMRFSLITLAIIAGGYLKVSKATICYLIVVGLIFGVVVEFATIDHGRWRLSVNLQQHQPKLWNQLRTYSIPQIYQVIDKNFYSINYMMDQSHV